MSTPVVLSDLENMGIAVGILLLVRTQPKIQVLYMYFRFMAAIFIFVIDFFHRLHPEHNILLDKLEYYQLFVARP